MDNKKLQDLWQNAVSTDQRKLLHIVISAAKRYDMNVYIVGGFVRDMLLGALEHSQNDFDLVIEGNAITLAKELANEYGGRMTLHSQFWTAKWYIHSCSIFSGYKNIPETLDLISARREWYEYPGALPNVEKGSIEDDIKRRDFTINTLALRLDANSEPFFIDLCNGIHDILNKEIRILHPESFVDDPTRIFRAVRYEKRYGFEIGADTKNRIASGLKSIHNVSGNRIRHELDLICNEKQGIDMMSRLDQLQVFKEIVPGLSFNQNTKDNILKISNSSIQVNRLVMFYSVWLMEYDSAFQESIFERLCMPNTIRHVVHDCSVIWNELSSISLNQPSLIVKALDRYHILAITIILELITDEHQKKILNLYINQWRDIHPFTDGKILLSLGIPAGPLYGLILNDLRSAWIDDKIHSLVEEEYLRQELIEKYMGKHS